MALGILNTSSIPMPILLDAIRHAETGHLSLDDASAAVSKKGAVGPYQFLEKNLHDMGYKMPRNIDPASVRNPVTARELAEKYITGYTEHHGFTTPLQQLAAYNMGPQATEAWLAAGGNFSDLPQETKEYVQRAAAYVANQQTEGQPMNEQYLGYFMDGQAAANPSTGPVTNLPGSDMPPSALNNPMLGPFMDGRAAALEGSLSSLTRQQQLEVQKQQILNLIASSEPGQMTGLMAQIPTDLRSDPDILAAMQSKGLLQSQPSDAVLSQPAVASTNQRGAQYGGILSQLGKPSGTPSNRRDQSPMAYKPAIDTNDMLIRVGLAGVGASGRGGLEALGAMGEEFGKIQDRNNQGLAAFQKAMAKETKGGSGIGSSGSIIVNDSINRALPLIGEGWAAGFASYLKGIPGSDAQKLANNLKTIQANIGFDKLQAMRDASPTGGALGQVSERELGFLQSVFGSLDQSQTAEELQYNLELLRYVYNSIVHGEGNHPYQMPVYGSASAAPSGLDPELQADIDKYANQ